MRQFGPRISCVKRFLITKSISLLIIGLFRFSVHFLLCLVVLCVFKEILFSFLVCNLLAYSYSQ